MGDESANVSGDGALVVASRRFLGQPDASEIWSNDSETRREPLHCLSPGEPRLGPAMKQDYYYGARSGAHIVQSYAVDLSKSAGSAFGSGTSTASSEASDGATAVETAVAVSTGPMMAARDASMRNSRRLIFIIPRGCCCRPRELSILMDRSIRYGVTPPITDGYAWTSHRPSEPLFASSRGAR